MLQEAAMDAPFQPTAVMQNALSLMHDPEQDQDKPSFWPINTTPLWPESAAGLAVSEGTSSALPPYGRPVSSMLQHLDCSPSVGFATPTEDHAEPTFVQHRVTAPNRPMVPGVVLPQFRAHVEAQNSQPHLPQEPLLSPSNPSVATPVLPGLCVLKSEISIGNSSGGNGSGTAAGHSEAQAQHKIQGIDSDTFNMDAQKSKRSNITLKPRISRRGHFITTLFSLLENKSMDGVLRWSPSGTSFLVIVCTYSFLPPLTPFLVS